MKRAPLTGWRLTGICEACGRSTVHGGRCLSCGWDPALAESCDDAMHDADEELDHPVGEGGQVLMFAEER